MSDRIPLDDLTSDQLDVLYSELEALRAGEEPGYGITPTAGQWIWRWNRTSPQVRLEVAANVISAGQRADRCFTEDHEGRLTGLTERIAQAEATIERVRVRAQQWQAAMIPGEQNPAAQQVLELLAEQPGTAATESTHTATTTAVTDLAKAVQRAAGATQQDFALTSQAGAEATKPVHPAATNASSSGTPNREMAAGIRRCDEAADLMRDARALREQIAAALYEHSNPGHRWADAHPHDRILYGQDADAVLPVILPGTRITATLARMADVERVIALYEQWVKAGPPPLGVSLSRWWDARLVELHDAIRPPAHTTEEEVPKTPPNRYDQLTDRGRQLMAAFDEVDLAEICASTEAERDGAYRERAHLVALLAAMTDGAVIAPAPDIDEPGWGIAYLTLGGRQASWHISPRDADLVAGIEYVPATDPRAQWDGHTTEEKYQHIAELTRAGAELSTTQAAVQRVRERCRAVRDRTGPAGMINASQILSLLSTTWPDGNFEAPLPGPTTPATEA
ncbi:MULTISPECIES: hypothetical protein [Streptomyces]